jgi:hypothetical protein
MEIILNDLLGEVVVQNVREEASEAALVLLRDSSLEATGVLSIARFVNRQEYPKAQSGSPPQVCTVPGTDRCREWESGV